MEVSTDDLQEGELIAVRKTNGGYQIFEVTEIEQKEFSNFPSLYLTDMKNGKKMKFIGLKNWVYGPSILSKCERDHIKR